MPEPTIAETMTAAGQGFALSCQGRRAPAPSSTGGDVGVVRKVLSDEIERLDRHFHGSGMSPVWLRYMRPFEQALSALSRLEAELGAAKAYKLSADLAVKAAKDIQEERDQARAELAALKEEKAAKDVQLESCGPSWSLSEWMETLEKLDPGPYADPHGRVFFGVPQFRALLKAIKEEKAGSEERPDYMLPIDPSTDPVQWMAPGGLKFDCAMCGESCVSDRPDGEARQEALDNGFSFDGQEMYLVCDDCYQRVMAAPPPGGGLVGAVALMDERGRKNPEGNSVMLWRREWDELRAALLSHVCQPTPRVEEPGIDMDKEIHDQRIADLKEANAFLEGERSYHQAQEIRLLAENERLEPALTASQSRVAELEGEVEKLGSALEGYRTPFTVGSIHAMTTEAECGDGVIFAKGERVRVIEVGPHPYQCVAQKLDGSAEIQIHDWPLGSDLATLKAPSAEAEELADIIQEGIEYHYKHGHGEPDAAVDIEDLEDWERRARALGGVPRGESKEPERVPFVGAELARTLEKHRAEHRAMGAVRTGSPSPPEPETTEEPPAPAQCECFGWALVTPAKGALDGHHPHCKHYEEPLMPHEGRCAGCGEPFTGTCPACTGGAEDVSEEEAERALEVVRATYEPPEVKPPCDCIDNEGGCWVSRCYCANVGDAESAAAWCADQNRSEPPRPGLSEEELEQLDNYLGGIMVHTSTEKRAAGEASYAAASQLAVLSRALLARHRPTAEQGEG